MERLRGAYQGIGTKYLPSLLTQLDLRNSELPTLHILVHLDTRSSPHNLMAKAHTYNLHPTPGSQCLAREIDQLQDPLLVQVGRVLRSADEHGVDGVQVWVRVGLVDHVVAGDGNVGLQRVGGNGPPEQVGEDAPVAVVFGIGIGDGRVRLKDGEAEGVVWGCC